MNKFIAIKFYCVLFVGVSNIRVITATLDSRITSSVISSYRSKYYVHLVSLKDNVFHVVRVETRHRIILMHKSVLRPNCPVWTFNRQSIIANSYTFVFPEISLDRKSTRLNSSHVAISY